MMEGGDGIAPDEVRLRLDLGVENHEPHFRHLPAGHDLCQAFADSLHLVARDADKALVPAHALPPARICSSLKKDSGRLETSSLSCPRKASRAGLRAMALSTMGSDPAR